MSDKSIDCLYLMRNRKYGAEKRLAVIIGCPYMRGKVSINGVTDYKIKIKGEVG